MGVKVYEPTSGTVVDATAQADGSMRQNVTTYNGPLTVMFDYDVRTDGNPVYIGQAVPGTATSATTWAIKKFTYDSSSRPTQIQNATGAWTNRVSLTYS